MKNRASTHNFYPQPSYPFSISHLTLRQCFEFLRTKAPMHTQALHAPGHVITSTKDRVTRHVWESYACHRHGGAIILLVRYMEQAPNTGTYILLDPFTRLLWDVFHNLRHQFIVCFSPCWVSVRSPSSLSKVASHIFAIFDAVQFATCCPNRSSHGPVQSRCATTHRYGRAYRRCPVVHGITGTSSEQWGLGRPSVSLGEEPSSATRIPSTCHSLWSTRFGAGSVDTHRSHPGEARW